MKEWENSKEEGLKHFLYLFITYNTYPVKREGFFIIDISTSNQWITLDLKLKKKLKLQLFWDMLNSKLIQHFKTSF